MKTLRTRNPLLGVVFVALTAATAHAQRPTAELGASLAGVTIGLGDNRGSTFGIPSSGFGILSPGVYVSIFAGPNVAVEPQIGFLWASSGGHSEHLLNFVGQVDYFFSGTDVSSPYVFGAAGVINTSGSGPSPKSVSAGLGYRAPVGGRLAFRVDGRWAHLTDGGGNSVVFTVSIGGLFGK